MDDGGDEVTSLLDELKTNQLCNMKIEIPQCIVQEAIECHLIQQGWTVKWTEIRSREVERREAHIAEIVCAIIANEFRRQKLLPYNKK